jgi:hypothetical protein
MFEDAPAKVRVWCETSSITSHQNPPRLCHHAMTHPRPPNDNPPPPIPNDPKHTHTHQALKYLKRWAVHIGPAFILAYGTVQWADHEFEEIHREHWD